MVMNNILKSNVKKRKFRLPLSAWLSYLLLTTLLFSAVSLAKYTASTTDSDGARVAGFDVSASPNKAEGQTDKIFINTTELNTVTYALNVRNNSEVVVRYTIIVKNVPTGVDVYVNGSENLHTDNENTTVIYTVGDVLDVNGARGCTIAFRAHDEYTKVGKYENITVEVRFDQVD